jgi:hypothetical protein
MILIPVIIGIMISTAWIIYEYRTSPLVDENENIIEEENE